MSDLNKCPHCNKSFIKLKQHITKSHHKYEFEVSNHPSTIKMTHTFPDGKKEEVVFNWCGNGDGERLSIYGSDKGTVKYDAKAKKISLVVGYKTVSKHETRDVDVHLGRYKIITN